MGYSTNFKGSLSFAEEPTASQLAYLTSLFGEDKRNHPEWGPFLAGGYWHYVKLELTEDFAGIRWNGMEKAGDMCGKVNTVTNLMRERWHEFRLTGRMDAQGEEIGDVWALVMDDEGVAQRVELMLEGRRVACPHCEQEFVLDPVMVEPTP